MLPKLLVFPNSELPPKRDAEAGATVVAGRLVMGVGAVVIVAVGVVAAGVLLNRFLMLVVDKPEKSDLLVVIG